MVRLRSVLKVIDNSGAKYVRCLKVLGKKKIGYLGDLLVVSVLALRGGRGRKIRVKRKEICLALVASSSFNSSRPGGFFTRPFQNSAVLLSRSFKPIGNRVFGLIFKELRLKKKFKALSVSSRII